MVKKGNIPWNKGKICKRGYKRPEHSKFMNDWYLKNKNSEVMLRRNKAISKKLKGRIFTDEWKQKLKKASKIRFANVPRKSKRPREWNHVLRNKIKERDKNKCVICESTNRLQVHHIDYNVLNNNDKNLITLCVNCHARSNNVRDFWEKRLFNTYVENWFEKKFSILSPENRYGWC